MKLHTLGWFKERVGKDIIGYFIPKWEYSKNSWYEFRLMSKDHAEGQFKQQKNGHRYDDKKTKS